MIVPSVQTWLERLGYAEEPAVLHRRGQDIREGHPYALEITNLLKPEGAIRAEAVFDVEGVPTVVFVSAGDGGPLASDGLDAIRQRIWNQNLATVIIEAGDGKARVAPARKIKDSPVEINLVDAQPDGPFSALDVASANLSRRFPAWFDIDARVDRKLLDNLSTTVKFLTRSGFKGSASELTKRRRAELLMGQVLFISYLEHRQIVGPTYKARRNVQQLHDLISEENRDGVDHLVDCLRDDFNGDFLGSDRHDPWVALDAAGFKLLNLFLRRTDMQTGQGDFWNYDFSFIPVELLSGLYESFLSDEQKAKEGAYYTPRHLAMMAVDQAFAESRDPLTETIFDGACGSGILLTTAYRRLISLVEARTNRQLSFKERRDLLVKQIFGADINFMACRVTAFSLYLSLLEGLDPADIMEAQDKENVKLPTLDGTNLFHGHKAQFFSDQHSLIQKRFSLLISNPPWAEASGDEVTAADKWSLRTKVPFVRRQIAGAYAIRALDFLAPEGRLCLILPIPQFLAPTSASFVSYFFSVVRPRRLINFGDLQNLLFPSTEHTCHLFIAQRRPLMSKRVVPLGETFDYCVPKADLSLLYGRLTMQSADRHSVLTQSVVENPHLLVTLMWGDANDIAIWTRLSLVGSFRDFWKGTLNAPRWVCRKGVHFEDKSRKPVAAKRLQDRSFVPIAALRTGSPVLHKVLLAKWPEDRKTVAGLSDDLLEMFDGPRVLFPDGFSKGEQSVRAVYFDKFASFNNSIGVIKGPKEDAALLQFAAVYLRSKLARYFLMMRGWKMLCERNGVHLTDVEDFPFFDPGNAPNPQIASSALSEVSNFMSDLAQLPELEQKPYYGKSKDRLDDLIFDYFDLTQHERDLVRETVDVLMPSIRPRSFRSLDTPAQAPADGDNFKQYANVLATSLTEWRKSTGGRGQFHVRVVANEMGRAGAVGIVRLEYEESKTAVSTADAKQSDKLVRELLSQFHQAGLSIVPVGHALQLVPDVPPRANSCMFVLAKMIAPAWRSLATTKASCFG